MLRIGETVDRYVVEAMIGQGGMAAVYRARHSTLDSLHAIKVLFITAPDIRTRLMREGKVQANLRHQNIVAVTDVLEIQGAPALVMEFVDGPPLDQWLAQNKPTLEEALFLFRGVLRGVMAAHERGVIHRDLKPANVLLAPTNEGVVPKVADFGLTKSVKSSSGHTQTGMAMGTPEYMAPEQIRDASDVDERVDMFALGCILYELVTGQRAFRGPDNVTVFNNIVNGVYESPKDLVEGDLPRPVLMALKWLLEPDREKRLASASELFDLLFEESLGPRLNMGTASLKPIPISTTIHEPTPIPAPQADVATQPPPGRRQMTPGGAGRATPSPVGRFAADTPTQVPVAVPEQADSGVVRLVVPILVVVVALLAVGWAISRDDPLDLIQPSGGETVEAPRPAPTVTPEPAGQADPVPPVPSGNDTPAPQPTQPSPQPAQPNPQPQPDPQPAQPNPQPQPDPQPSAQPDPQPAEPQPPAPEPEGAADGAEVAVTGGGAQGVWLVGPSGRHKLPATVPAGSYTIEADFGSGPVKTGEVGVRDGQNVSVKCEGAFFSCKAM